MPLVLNPDNTVTGVYEGQDAPLRIGNIPFVVGPHVIGFTQIDDSISMQAFFDPSISQKVRSSTEKFNHITYIQVGQFYINGTPLPVSIHNNAPPYPIPNNTPPPDSHLPFSSWVDICKVSTFHLRRNKMIIVIGKHRTSFGCSECI